MRCCFRIRKNVHAALQTESRRRRRWLSDLADDLLQQGVERFRGRSLQSNELTTPEPRKADPARRHWVRLALNGAIWNELQCEADALDISVAQLTRQIIGRVVYRGNVRELMAPLAMETVEQERLAEQR